MANFVAYLSKLKIFLYGAWAILVFVQMTDVFDPFRGWQKGVPHYVAAVLCLLAYWVARIRLRFIPKFKVTDCQVIIVFAILVICFVASLNIVLGLRPPQWFLEAGGTELRLALTLVFYLLFAIALGVLIALLNRLKPGG